jgi:hypothetical protein
MSLLDMQKFCERANRDPEYLIAARFWNASLKIEMEDSAHVLKVRDGQLAVEAASSTSEACNIAISAPLEDWKKMLEPVPQPFYQDLFAATVYHGFSYDGDLELMFAYYPALRRMVELMRECAAD